MSVIEKTVYVKLDGDEAIAELNKLNDKIETLEKSVEDLNDEMSETGTVGKKEMAAVDDGAQKSEKSVNKLTVSFKRLGTAFKAIGIGAVLAVVAAFSQVASQSQGALDGMATTMNVVQLLFQDMMSGFERFRSADSMGDYFKGLYDQAQALTDITNYARIAQAELNETVAESELEAEKLRRVRDNYTLSYAQRIKASEDLKKVIDDQLEATSELVDVQLEAAKAEFAARPTLESSIALIEARTAKLDEQNRVATANSEWQAAHNGLLKEEIDLARQLEEMYSSQDAMRLSNFGDEALEDEQGKLEARKNQILLNIEEIQEADNIATADRALALGQYYNELYLLQGEAAENERELQQIRTEMSFESAALMIASIKNVAEEGSQLYKQLASLEVVVDTAAGIQKIWATNSNTPWGIAFAVAQTAFLATSGYAALKKINSAELGSSGGDLSGDTAPSFNVVAATQTSALEQNLLSNGIRIDQETPIKAYVTSTDVTTQQALDRNIQANAGF